MGSLLLTALVVMLTLSAIAYWSGKRARDQGKDSSQPLTLLPGDISYESQNGNFKFYFPITTSIVLSIVLSLILRLFS